MVLGLLGILTAGAIALGLVLAPGTASLLVHNAGGVLATAPSFTADVSSGSEPYHLRYDYTAPDHMVESLVLANGHVERSVTLSSTEIKNRLAGFSLVTVKDFSAKGAGFVATEPVVDLYPPADRPLIRGGTARWVVTIRTGVIAEEKESVNVLLKKSSAPKTNSADVKIISVGGKPVAG